MTSLPLLPTQSSCTACDLHDQGHGIPKTVGIGTRHLSTSCPPVPESSCIIYVGRNPGANEDEQGQCFVGKSGDLLQSAIIGGIGAQSLATIYLTNAVRCYTVNNDAPPARSYTACATYLATDLSTILHHHEPAPVRILVFLGGESVKYGHERLLNVSGMSLKQGFNEQLVTYDQLVDPTTTHLPKSRRTLTPVPPFKVINLYHPSFLLRNPNAIHPTVGHNQLVLDALRGISSSPSSPDIQPLRPPVP